MPREQSSVLIAPLGGQPQIITFALDALLTQGENIREVIILYLAEQGEHVNQAMTRFSAEFADDHYAGRPCRLRTLPIRDDLNRLPDIRDETDAEITRDMLQDLLASLKNERHHLHVCMSGGRRMIALLMMTVALFYFDYRDKLWHVFTPAEMQKRADGGAIMHARPEDGVYLIQVPLIPLGNRYSLLQEFVRHPPPQNVTHSVQYLDRQHQARCEEVISQLTGRGQEALQLFAAGLTLEEVANQMTIQPDTVNDYKKKILALCRNAWPDQKITNYFQLPLLFGSYFER